MLPVLNGRLNLGGGRSIAQFAAYQLEGLLLRAGRFLSTRCSPSSHACLRLLSSNHSVKVMKQLREVGSYLEKAGRFKFDAGEPLKSP